MQATAEAAEAAQGQGAYKLHDRTFKAPTKDRSGNYFVFTAANYLSPQKLLVNKDWALGGMLRTKSLTLRHRGGYIRRCEITPLEVYHHSEKTTNIHPERRSMKDLTYELTDNITGETTIIGVTPDGQHDGLLRTPFFPMEEVDNLVNKQDGLVLMPVQSTFEAEKAQYFLFPQWDDIFAGRKPFPTLISDLKQYFLTRKTAAGRDSFFNKVVDAAILSCDEYNAYALRITKQAHANLNRAEKEGMAWSIGGDAVLCFEQTGIPRKDMVTQNNASQMDKLAGSLNTLVDLQTKQFQQQAPAAPAAPANAPQLPQIDPNQYEAFLAWQQDQAGKSNGEDVIFCSGVNKDQSPCKNAVRTLGETCRTHTPKEGDTGAA